MACEEGPEHAASGALANKTNGAPSCGRSRRPLLPMNPEDKVMRLKSRLREGGADMEAVGLCSKVESIEALQRRLTRDRFTSETGSNPSAFLRRSR